MLIFPYTHNKNLSPYRCFEILAWVLDLLNILKENLGLDHRLGNIYVRVRAKGLGMGQRQLVSEKFPETGLILFGQKIWLRSGKMCVINGMDNGFPLGFPLAAPWISHWHTSDLLRFR